jgi:hypothetical protein
MLLSLAKSSLLASGHNLYMSVFLAGLAGVLLSGLLASLLGTRTGLVAIISHTATTNPRFSPHQCGL